MSVIQFAFRRDWYTGPTVLDCRKYMGGCFSQLAARTHPRFEECVEDGLAIYAEHGEVKVGCLQGMHRSKAVAAEIRFRLQEEE